MPSTKPNTRSGLSGEARGLCCVLLADRPSRPQPNRFSKLQYGIIKVATEQVPTSEPSVADPDSKKQPVSVVARMMWFFPIVLVLLAANQFKVGVDLRETATNGVAAVAEITDFKRVDRADVTYGHVSLRIRMADGSIVMKEKMPLPYSLLHRVEGEDQVDVHVLKNASQDVVIDLVSGAQWRLALIQGVIAALAALMAITGIVAWTRYLKKHGDPALR